MSSPETVSSSVSKVGVAIHWAGNGSSGISTAISQARVAIVAVPGLGVRLGLTLPDAGTISSVARVASGVASGVSIDWGSSCVASGVGAYVASKARVAVVAAPGLWLGFRVGLSITLPESMTVAISGGVSSSVSIDWGSSCVASGVGASVTSKARVAIVAVPGFWIGLSITLPESMTVAISGGVSSSVSVDWGSSGVASGVGASV